jgi:hypothetical protein
MRLVEKDCIHPAEPAELRPGARPLGDLLSRLIWPSIILVVYVLSTGPATKAVRKFDWETKHPRMVTAMDIFYAPIQLAYDRWPLANSFLDWYIETAWRAGDSS